MLQCEVEAAEELDLEETPVDTKVLRGLVELATLLASYCHDDGAPEKLVLDSLDWLLEEMPDDGS